MLYAFKTILASFQFFGQKRTSDEFKAVNLESPCILP